MYSTVRPEDHHITHTTPFGTMAVPSPVEAQRFQLLEVRESTGKWRNAMAIPDSGQSGTAVAPSSNLPPPRLALGLRLTKFLPNNRT